VNADGAENVTGQILSPPVTFQVRLPAALKNTEHWVAAPSYKVALRFDRELEGLTPGDAFQREVVLEATDVLAMMLPEFQPQDVPGLAVYPEPPELINRSNRGQSQAARSLKISYVVETEGQYLLPGEDFIWWDTKSARAQVLSLPPVSFTVGMPLAASEEASLDKTVRDHRPWQFIGLALAGLAVLVWLLRRLYPRWIVVRNLWQHALARLRSLRQPALPERLNP